MEFDNGLIQLVATFVLGAVVGVINTLAGGGSIITLPFLMMVGLPALSANASNRLGIFVQTSVSSYSFIRKGLIRKKHLLYYVLPSVITALIGAYIASNVTEQSMAWVVKTVISCLVVLIVFLNIKDVVFKGKAGLFTIPLYVSIIVISILGFYGGFIQAGFGLIFFGFLHFLQGKPADETNAIKNLVVATYSLPTIILFMYYGLIEWKIAGVLALGQGLGGWIGAKIATESPKGNSVVKILFYLMLAVSVAKLYGVF